MAWSNHLQAFVVIICAFISSYQAKNLCILKTSPFAPQGFYGLLGVPSNENQEFKLTFYSEKPPKSPLSIGLPIFANRCSLNVSQNGTRIQESAVRSCESNEQNRQDNNQKSPKFYVISGEAPSDYVIQTLVICNGTGLQEGSIEIQAAGNTTVSAFLINDNNDGAGKEMATQTIESAPAGSFLLNVANESRFQKCIQYKVDILKRAEVLFIPFFVGGSKVFQVSFHRFVSCH